MFVVFSVSNQKRMETTHRSCLMGGYRRYIQHFVLVAVCCCAPYRRRSFFITILLAGLPRHVLGWLEVSKQHGPSSSWRCDPLLRRVRQRGGGRCNQSQGMQVVYGRQVLQCQLPEEPLAEA